MAGSSGEDRQVGRAGWPVEGLVTAAQAGDTVAIAALVSGAHPHVQRFAASMCASPQDAEDAAQEALIVLFSKIGTLRATGALGSWMFRIVRNECLRRSRQLARRAVPGPEPLGATEAFEHLGRTAASAEDDVLNRLEAHRIAAAVAGLPDDQRRVLVMRDVQGRPGRAVAEALGLSTAAMKSRLHRARTTVREVLQEPPR